MVEAEEAPGSWFQLGTVQLVVAIWEMTQWIEDRYPIFASFSLSSYDSAFRMNKKINLNF